jgi:hypothetical protein
LLGDYNVIRKEDLEKTSQSKMRSKTIMRPDKIFIHATKAALKLPLTITHCSYNGKCYELLGETKNGHSVILYSGKAVDSEKDMNVYFNPR